MGTLFQVMFGLGMPSALQVSLTLELSMAMVFLEEAFLLMVAGTGGGMYEGGKIDLSKLKRKRLKERYGKETRIERNTLET